METRSLPIGFELKAVSGRTIEGYAAAWAKDRVGDIIDAKAFDRTIRANPDVAVFVGHDASKLPVGEPVEMRADGHGLFTRSLIYDTPDGDALLAVAKARLSKGRTLGMSIGFRTVKDHWDAKQKARILEDVDLIEYSFLASPLLAANPQAYALGVKSGKAAPMTTENSYEELQEDLEEAIALLLNHAEDEITTVATFPDHVIVCLCESGDDDMRWFDVPYTLGTTGPVLGAPQPLDQAFIPAEPKARAIARLQRKATQGMPARSYAWVDSSGTGHLDISDEGHVRAAMARFNQTHFDSPAAKRSAARKIVARARSHGMDVADDSAVAQAAKGAPRMDLEDTAFAFIEPGGVLDEEHKTVPRSHRHFQHHDENGDVDIESLKAILTDPDLFAHGDEVAAHILRHAQAAGVTRVKIDKDDAHEPQWKGLGARMVVREYQAGLLTEAVGQNFLAYERVGIDTKDGMHVSPKLQKQIADETEVWTSLVTKAKEIEQGIDGQALVDTWRTAFQLLDLEEVA